MDNMESEEIQELLYDRMEKICRCFRHRGKPGQHRILRTLKNNGSMSQQDLQEQLHLQSSSISEILPKLEHAGYITRVRDESDKRCMLVSITQAGIDFFDENEVYQHQKFDDLFSCLDQSEKLQLLSLLDKIHENWVSNYSSRSCKRKRKEKGEIK